MKKILFFLSLVLSLFFSIDTTFWLWECNYDVDKIDSGQSIWSALDECLKWTALVSWENVRLDDASFATQIKEWVNNISIYLWIFAVFSIVFWGLMLTLSEWEDEKITKAKNIIKWWILWFLALISISAIINLIVKIMYSL